MGNISRRKFIGRAAAVSVVGVSATSTLLGCVGKAGAGIETARVAAGAVRKLDKIGVQLYTLRSIMTGHVPDVLASLSKIGYDQVEFAGYYDHPAADIRKILDDNGLSSPSVHVGLELMLDNADAWIADAAAIGHEYIVVPWLAPPLRTSIDSYKKVSAQLNEMGVKCKASGIQLAYHNHDFEFHETDGEIPYDVMLAECDADLVKMQLDLFWITEAGRDPLEYFAAHPGRFHLCHVKDRMADGTMVPVGKGAIDFGKIFSMSEISGLRYYIVEHDNPDDPLESVKASYDYLKILEF